MVGKIGMTGGRPEIGVVVAAAANQVAMCVKSHFRKMCGLCVFLIECLAFRLIESLFHLGVFPLLPKSV